MPFQILQLRFYASNRSTQKAKIKNLSRRCSALKYFIPVGPLSAIDFQTVGAQTTKVVRPGAALQRDNACLRTQRTRT